MNCVFFMFFLRFLNGVEIVFILDMGFYVIDLVFSIWSFSVGVLDNCELMFIFY